MQNWKQKLQIKTNQTGNTNMDYIRSTFTQQKIQTEWQVQESSKNGTMVSKRRCQIEKKEILSVTSFIEDKMRTLPNYRDRLKKQIDINLILNEMKLIEQLTSYLTVNIILKSKDLQWPQYALPLMLHAFFISNTYKQH